MIDWSYILARLVSAIGSWIDSSNLRNRVYKMAEEADNVYWVRIGNRWANIETGEFRPNDRETYINAVVALVVFSIVVLIVELTKGY